MSPRRWKTICAASSKTSTASPGHPIQGDIVGAAVRTFLPKSNSRLGATASIAAMFSNLGRSSSGLRRSPMGAGARMNDSVSGVIASFKACSRASILNDGSVGVVGGSGIAGDSAGTTRCALASNTFAQRPHRTCPSRAAICTSLTRNAVAHAGQRAITASLFMAPRKLSCHSVWWPLSPRLAPAGQAYPAIILYAGFEVEPRRIDGFDLSELRTQYA